MKSWKKYIWFVIAVGSFIVSWLLYTYQYSPTLKQEVKRFQSQINTVEDNLNEFTTTSTHTITKNNIDVLWKKHKLRSNRFGAFIYKNDSLVFWNENKTPVPISLAKKDFTSKVIKLENGYYLCKKVEHTSFTLITTALIKNTFLYENESLTNEFVADLTLPLDTDISFQPLEISSIYSLEKNYLFSLYPTGEKNTTPAQENLVFLLYLIGLIGLYRGVVMLFGKYRENNLLIVFAIPILLLLLRWLSLQYNWFSQFSGFEIFDPNIYASSALFPTLGDFVLNLIIISIICNWIIQSKNKVFERSSFLAYIAYIFLLAFSYSISVVFNGIVANSSIPLEIDQLFLLNRNSFIGLAGIGLLFYCYFVFARRIIALFAHSTIKTNTLATFWFLTGVGYFILEFFFGTQLFFTAIWPLAINGILIYVEYKYNKQYTFGVSILLLFIFALYGALNLSEFNQRNEFQERELYAHQLVSDQDETTEVEYSLTQNELTELDYLKNIENYAAAITVSEFKKELETRLFHGFWERYAMDFYLFDSLNQPIINYKSNKLSNYSNLQEIIASHSITSEYNENIYFVKDYVNQLNYIIKQPILTQDSTAITLIATLKSKKIPEQIGFPRLLINDNAQVFEALENYSMAKYQNGKLVKKFGDYNYPLDKLSFLSVLPNKNGFVEFDNMSHYIHSIDADNLIILSKPSQTLVAVMTSFSYLFTFFGLLLFIPLFAQRGTKAIQFNKLNLSFKIQLVLVALVVVALLVFGLASGSFVRTQYDEYTNDIIQERIYSVETEVQQKLGDKEYLDQAELGNYMEYILQKFARVFVTDINLYDLDGKLLASSQPKIYSFGLTSGQMDPDAYQELEFLKRSEYIHQENIGKLNYNSAYIPFVNRKGKLLAYLNLQHFAKQNEYESQISGFLVAIINLAVFLLVITIIIAIFVSNWITAPLKLIQKNVSSLQFGKENTPIAYDANDEIGALVKDYNNKLSELKSNALELAKSERESAWREMAKQVAHEIKNPLTPMKLRLQHYQRSFDPQDPKGKEKLDKVTNSIIEQIDALTNIANEFSNFAKMPKVKEEMVNMILLIENCISFFNESTPVKINFEANVEELWTYADKDLMLRVFNNLIKNALQAIPENSDGNISIKFNKEEEFMFIAVEDNGCGIPEETKSKIFVPNFTTKSTGTGLGLAMVKQIIESHGGKIGFESFEGEGTTFTVTLPITTKK